MPLATLTKLSSYAMHGMPNKFQRGVAETVDPTFAARLKATGFFDIVDDKVDEAEVATEAATTTPAPAPSRGGVRMRVPLAPVPAPTPSADDGVEV